VMAAAGWCCVWSPGGLVQACDSNCARQIA
jgi:hypothetical protein